MLQVRYHLGYPKVVPLIPNFSDIENEAKEKGKNALIKSGGYQPPRRGIFTLGCSK